MATLAVDTTREYEIGEHNDIGVIAADIIFEGSAVGDNGSGFARPLVAGDPFRGFAQDKVDNSAGSAGDLNVRVNAEGKIKLSVGSLAITDVGAAVYASDDNTFVLTQSTNSYIGRVHRFVSTGVGIVSFSANKSALASITALTDSSTGTASDTIADVTATPTQTLVNNNFATLAERINVLEGFLK